MTYSTPSTLGRVLELCLGLMIVVVPLSVHAGVFSLLSPTPQEALASNIPEVVKTELVLDAPVLTAALNSDPASSRGGADLLIEDGVLVSTGPVGAEEVSKNRQNGGEISVYVVREGDSLSMIADMFDVTANTILWANDLKSAKAIKPGQTLIILPIAGVRHVVKTGDTIALIAKKYEANADEIVSFNQLTADEKLAVGATVIVPGGAMHSAVAKTPVTKGSSASTGSKSSGFMFPAPGTVKTQGIHGYNAVDLAGAIGTNVRAAASGQVIVSKASGWNGGYGQYIVIKHNNGTQTLYAHLSSNAVVVGDYVDAGQSIGALGNSGKSTGPHLHFEVRGGKNPF